MKFFETRNIKYAYCLVAILINPLFIIRRSLYKKISKYSLGISGDLLDFGCGEKPYQDLFSVDSYIGMDTNFSGHDHERSSIDIIYDGVNFPEIGKQFDCVVAFEVFEHVFDIDNTLKQLRFLLKSEGHMLFTIPFFWEEHETPYDFYRYTRYSVDKILNKNGFELIAIEPTASDFLTIGQLVTNFIWRRLESMPKLVKISVQLLLIFPVNAFFVLADIVLPKTYKMPLNFICVSRIKR